MEIAKVAKIVLPLCIAICPILLFFSLPLSFSQLQNLLASKFITVAKPSHLVMFFTCNVIVIRILLGSSSPSNGDFEWFFSLPPLVDEVEYEEEKAKDHEDYDNKSEDFVPALVCVEYYKKEKAKDEHYDDNNDEDSDGFHGYDGYDEDNDDEGNSSDVSSIEDKEDDDLDTRIEEFIAKIYKKWREELLNDKLLCIEAA